MDKLTLEKHLQLVRAVYSWIVSFAPHLLKNIPGANYKKRIVYEHDSDLVKEPLIGLLQHKYTSPHHWEYWVCNDIVLDIPYYYTLEMVCDWIAVGFAEGLDMDEIFNRYMEQKDIIKLSTNTRSDVEYIFNEILERLDGGDIFNDK